MAGNVGNPLDEVVPVNGVQVSPAQGFGLLPGLSVRILVVETLALHLPLESLHILILSEVAFAHSNRLSDGRGPDLPVAGFPVYP